MSEAIYSPQEVLELTKNLNYILVDKTGQVITIASLKSSDAYKYYVYLLIDPRNWIPFYAGKGCDYRCLTHLNEKYKTENLHKWNKISKIWSVNLNPIILIVECNMEEKSAYDLEESLILSYGREDFEPNGCLTNICSNNRPPTNKGVKKSRKTVEKMAKTRTGMKMPAGTGRKGFESRKRNGTVYHPPSGANSTCANSYIVTSKDGEVIFVKGLRNFCRENGLIYTTFSKIANGSTYRKTHHGYSIQKVVD